MNVDTEGVSQMNHSMIIVL